jgi:hypothetical protein
MPPHAFLPGERQRNRTFLLGASTSENDGDLPAEIWLVAVVGR